VRRVRWSSAKSRAECRTECQSFHDFRNDRCRAGNIENPKRTHADVIDQLRIGLREFIRQHLRDWPLHG